MKVTVTIDIFDSTSEKDLNTRGLTRNDVGKLYRIAFEQLMEGICAPGAETEIRCSVTDNTIGEREQSDAADV